MADYQVAWNPTTKVATVQTRGDILPGGSTKAGEFDHNEAGDQISPDQHSHVLYHHVRDVLYKVGVQDMQRLVIAQDITYTALVSFVLAPGTVTLTVASPTQQLTVTPTPGGANPAIASWVSSDPTKATVSATGLVTRVANGTTTITATSVDGAKVATRLITVTA